MVDTMLVLGTECLETEGFDPGRLLRMGSMKQIQLAGSSDRMDCNSGRVGGFAVSVGCFANIVEEVEVLAESLSDNVLLVVDEVGLDSRL